MTEKRTFIAPPPGFSEETVSGSLFPTENCDNSDKKENEDTSEILKILDSKIEQPSKKTEPQTKNQSKKTKQNSQTEKQKECDKNHKKTSRVQGRRKAEENSETLSSRPDFDRTLAKSDKEEKSYTVNNKAKDNRKYVPVHSPHKGETGGKSETTTTLPSCIICCEPIVFFAVGDCNHREVCSLCSLRLRELYAENGCPICKKPLTYVIYTRDGSKKFEEYDTKTLIYDDSLRVYFDSAEYHAEVKKLWLLQCPLCPPHVTPPFSSFSKLQRHTQQTHGLVYCYVCIKYRKVFLHEQKLYPRSELSKHRLEGDPELKLPPHSYCEYCKTWLFSDDELFLHCYQTHETCFICESDGIKYQYFKDYAHLEKHFEEAHFPCKEKSCLQERFVVFKTEFELKVHRVSVHLKGQKISRRDRTVPLDFPTLSFSAQYTNNDDISSALSTRQPLPRNRYANNIEEESDELVSPSSANNTNTNSNIVAPFRLRFNESNSFLLNSQVNLQKRTSSSSANSPRKPLTKEELASRNRAVTEATRAFLGDESKFKEFQRASAFYRQGRISASDYWDKFLSLFEPKDTTAVDLFESILDLLPEKEKHLRTNLEPNIAQLRQKLEHTRSNRRDNLTPSTLGWSTRGYPAESVSIRLPKNSDDTSLSKSSTSYNISPEEFPALSANTTIPITLTANYSALLPPQGQLRDEDFPSLSSAYSRPLSPSPPAPPTSSNCDEQRKGQSRSKKKKVVLSWG
jgi:hypothetical protein